MLSIPKFSDRSSRGVVNGSLAQSIVRHRTTLILYVAACGSGVIAGKGITAEGGSLWLLTVALLAAIVLGVALLVRLETLFAAWLFAAPILQGAGGGYSSGYPHQLFRIFYLIPPMMFILRMASGERTHERLRAVDVFPAAYLAYIVISAQLTPESLKASDAGLKSIYAVIGVGIAAYYIVAFARAGPGFSRIVVRSLVWSAALVAVLALVEAAFGWNPWGHEVVQSSGLRRAIATFPSPFALGTFLGGTLAFALATLLWNGPRSLRRPSRLCFGLAIPALYFTYSRGPIIAIAAVGLLMVMVAKRARWPSLLALIAVAVCLFAVWDRISASPIYKERLGRTQTLTTRTALQDASLKLIGQRPVFGWGYDTFDRIKQTVPTRHAEIVRTSTSHDAFFTILVELGPVGFTLLVAPWLVIGCRAISAARRGLAEPWIVAGSVGAIATYALSAGTYDTRFFSLVVALPWLALGLARRALATNARDLDPI